MTLLEFLILLLIAGICGGVAQALAGLSRGGCLASVALGFIGALLGPYLANALGMPEIFVIRVGDQLFPIVWSIIGALVVVLIIGLLTPRRY